VVSTGTGCVPARCGGSGRPRLRATGTGTWTVLDTVSWTVVSPFCTDIGRSTR
jgi:hypothetical protein